MTRAGTASRRRLHAYAFASATTAIVLAFAFFEWLTEKFVSDHSRAAGTAIEIAVVLIGTLVFRPIHQRVEAAVDEAFNRRKRHALEALAHFRRELTSFSDAGQLLRRVVEALEHHMEARAAAVYVRRDFFRAQVSSFDVASGDVDESDPLVVRLRSSGAPAQPPLLHSSVPGTDAFAMTIAGELIGFITLESKHGDYESDELQMLAGLAADLAIALVSHDPSLRPRPNAVPNNLPADLYAPIGRDREYTELREALGASHLVTLTGPGGIGKTRLALHCASMALQRYEHGVWFIDLAPLDNGNLIAATILAALGSGVAEDGTELSGLLEHLRSRQMLLVIDNCEHLLGSVVPIIKQIRSTCPHVTVLATSRELLHLDGECVYRLGPLRPQDAIELFVRRASAVAPAFDPRERRDAIADICVRLDGLPLAVELAAARVRALSINEIAQRLNERFRLLTGGSRTASPRQQTLAATIEWSFDLLPAEEQSLFIRLSVFRGSFALAAAAAVCAHDGNCDEFHVLDVLTSLADKSLLTVSVGLTTRYRLLEMIRDFALQKAAGRHVDAGASHQHAAHFAAVAGQAYHEFDSQLSRGWLERLAPDVDNFRASLEWTLEGAGDRRIGAQLAADCGPIFLRLEFLGEGLRWCAAAREVSDISPATAGRIEYVASMMHNNLGQMHQALSCAERAVSFYERSADERGHVRALSQVAQLYARAHRHDEAKPYALEAIRRAELLNEPHVTISVLRRSAYALPLEEIDAARKLFERAVAKARETRDSEELALTLHWWATREAATGQFERAMDLTQQSLEFTEGKARMFHEAHLTCYAFAAGRVSDAVPHAYEALRLAADAENPLFSAFMIACCAALHAANEPRDAAKFFGYAREQMRTLEWEGESDDRLALERAEGIIRKELGDDSFPELSDAGSDLRQGDVVMALLASAPGREGHSTVNSGDGVRTLLR